MNTISSSLVTDCLAKTGVTTLQHQLAPMKSFSLQFEADAQKPRSTIQIPLISSGSSTLTISQGDTFEAGNATVSNIAVAMVQMSQPFHVDNFDLQGGLRLENLIEINAKKFAASLLDVPFALITTGNYGAAIVTSAAAAFSWSDLAPLFAALKKSTTKNLVLETEYAARLANSPSLFQVVGGDVNGAKAFGLDGLYSCSRFDACGPNISGFMCNPQCLAVGVGLPMTPSNAPGLVTGTLELPGLGLRVQTNIWTSVATRSLWCSFDICIGAAVADNTALKLISSV